MVFTSQLLGVMRLDKTVKRYESRKGRKGLHSCEVIDAIQELACRSSEAAVHGMLKQRRSSIR